MIGRCWGNVWWKKWVLNGVKQRVRDADEARRLIQEVGNKGMVLHVESNGQ